MGGYYYGYGFGIDPTIFLVLIGVVLCLLAQAKVKTTVGRYSRVYSASGLTGAMAAERMLRAAGITDVAIRHVAGTLTDHYDPRSKTVNLSDGVYNSQSVAAVGIACHECGHAIQDARAYFPLTFRHSLVPVANFGSSISWPLILFGVLAGGMRTTNSIGFLLIQAGIFCFSLAVLFQMVTLPVEFNASRRAMQMIEQTGMLTVEESRMTRKVLTAAALTYVAGAASAVLQLLRLLILFGGGRRDD
ncbi:MAG: zinc metallopeptidase [Lachnospiraceae bacterium]|nr:zinc metallopeptidase [Lachnospiraceae bacterium]